MHKTCQPDETNCFCGRVKKTAAAKIILGWTMRANLPLA
jgi:hypothetical protein